ncbi:AbfB domain-containing protein [Streptomyces sp. NPDC020362]|uniref:AbfB domain-containing protein n=1 Tax=unclassified Streptomyces TaxID=2593676 RepID=UPI000B30F9CB
MGNSLQSVNFPDRFIRHQNFLGELTQIVSELDREDATFEIVPGLADSNLISFRSFNFPLHYLRHQNFRIKLHEGPNVPLGPPPPETPEMQLMRKDATFVMVPGLADPSAVSFRSVNFPTRFIRHRNFDLFLEETDNGNDVDRKDSTFRLLDGLEPEPPGPR